MHQQVLWLKSRTSEVWLYRRTNYTSLAVMSMVGYLLGLRDRHPSNLMLHRYSGKILHIDFGDCFEASMKEKFPEKAFVHDPLINWRLFNFNEVPQMAQAPAVVNSEESSSSTNLAQPQRGARERELLQAVHQLGDASEVLNERAVMVMARMSNKLTGRDFSTASTVTSASQLMLDSSNPVPGDAREVEHGLSVKLQVQKLIDQATSYENLCQNYVGWCPFW
ncbi:serine/threonine-protein kinase TOR-like isoform X2 [Silene latifolia]|uniref:serine/threonine-protein kinase TOR-like isoform X2 n=1 Tax=Silene latifolia TaxID=37657 RepID=UPI003D781D1F